MERLLKKQDSTKIGKQTKSKIIRTLQYPVISYRHSINESKLIFPNNMDFPLKPQLPKDPPEIIKCCISDCNNMKVYNCSKTNMPLCSFACYQKHMSTIDI